MRAQMHAHAHKHAEHAGPSSTCTQALATSIQTETDRHTPSYALAHLADS